MGFWIRVFILLSFLVSGCAHQMPARDIASVRCEELMKSVSASFKTSTPKNPRYQESAWLLTHLGRRSEALENEDFLIREMTTSQEYSVQPFVPLST